MYVCVMSVVSTVGSMAQLGQQVGEHSSGH